MQFVTVSQGVVNEPLKSDVLTVPAAALKTEGCRASAVKALE